MEKKIISEEKYDKLKEKIRYDAKDINELINIYDYLKDKKAKYYNGIHENAHLSFLESLLFKTESDRLSGYSEVDEEFLKSEYLSKELKNEIYDRIKNYNCPSDLVNLLNGEKLINDFSKEEIKQIMNYDIPDDNKEKYNYFCHLINNYLFVLDGTGVVEYIKELYKEQLPIVMLRKSNVVTRSSYYSGYGVDYSLLGQRHLFSLYKKFVKYYPDKAEEFEKLVNYIPRLTATEFINNYNEFINNGLDSNFILKEGNISIDGVYDQTRDFVGIVSIFSLLGEPKSVREIEVEKEFEKRTNDSIKKEFNEMVKEYKKSQDSKEDIKEYVKKYLTSK